MDYFDLNKLITLVRELVLNAWRKRHVVRRHGRSYRGNYQSIKFLIGSGQFESGLSRDVLRMAEQAPGVLEIIDEPFTMPYWLDGEWHAYTPDYLWRLRNEQFAIVEVKYAKEANTPSNRRRFAVIRKVLEAAGFTFVIFTEEEIRPLALQRNLSLLESHRHLTIPPVVVGQILGHVRGGTPRLDELAERIGSRPYVLAALSQGIIAADIRKAPLTNGTLLRKAV